MTQILAMAKRLEEAEKTIEQLQSSAEARASPAINGNLVPSTYDNALEASAFKPTPSVESAAPTWSVNSAPLEPTEPASPSSESVLPDLSLDQDGKICFYGPTSAVHDPPNLDSPESQPSITSNKLSKVEASAYLSTRTKEAQEWENFALKQAAIQTDVPYTVIERLLRIHWTWISPMFMWVYRPAFIRELIPHHALMLQNLRLTPPKLICLPAVVITRSSYLWFCVLMLQDMRTGKSPRCSYRRHVCSSDLQFMNPAPSRLCRRFSS